MFLVPAYASIAQPRPQMVLSRKIGMNWSLTWLLLTLLIGYRFEVGGDLIGLPICLSQSIWNLRCLKMLFIFC